MSTPNQHFRDKSARIRSGAIMIILMYLMWSPVFCQGWGGTYSVFPDKTSKGAVNLTSGFFFGKAYKRVLIHTSASHFDGQGNNFFFNYPIGLSFDLSGSGVTMPLMENAYIDRTKSEFSKYLKRFRLGISINKYEFERRAPEAFRAINDLIYLFTKLAEINKSQAEENHLIWKGNDNSQPSLPFLYILSWPGNAVAIGSIALFVALIWYKYKRHGTRLLAVKQRQLRLKAARLKLLQEDTLLLESEMEEMHKEVHHRVKNNLQMVMSLLNSQSRYLEHPVALEAIEESQNRLQTMVILFQKLYGQGEEEMIDMPSYVNEIDNYLSSQYPELSNISTIRTYIDPVQLNSSQAVLAGLFIGEAISNTYRSPHTAAVNVSALINLQQDRFGILTLSALIQGRPGKVSNCPFDQLGITVMRGLCEQLKGSFKIEQQHGLLISAVFEREREIQYY